MSVPANLLEGCARRSERSTYPRPEARGPKPEARGPLTERHWT
ncbi:MAG TPA: hypothetical protein VFH68_20635 [Polyangia bacterium]|nr:hypothetical protein [Polyangia bacterium]